MLRIYVSIGVLLFLTWPLSCDAQEVGQAGTAQDEIQAGRSADTPGPPDEIRIESPAGNVLLPHKVHVKDKKLKCTLCHHQIRAVALDTPHPDYLTSSWINCQTCHNADSKARKKYYKCSDCHHSEPDNIADETLSSKVVIHKSCWKCHEAGTGVKASEGCGNCHVKEEKSSELVKHDG